MDNGDSILNSEICGLKNIHVQIAQFCAVFGHKNIYSDIYPIIRHKSVDVRKLQVAILARSTREMFQIDRILPRYTMSRVRVNFFIREKIANDSRPARRSRSPLCGI